MKRTFQSTIIAMALLFAVTVFARDKDRTITLTSTTSVNGQKLEAGRYRIHLQEGGSATEVQFLQGNKEVASAPAQVLEREDAPRNDGVVTKESSDGTMKLVEIQFASQRSVIHLGNSDSTSGN